MHARRKPQRNLLLTILVGTTLIGLFMLRNPMSAIDQQPRVFGDLESRDIEIEYTPDTDGFVIATVDATDSGGAGDIAGVINGSQICRVSVDYSVGDERSLRVKYNSITMPVATGDRWIIRYKRLLGSPQTRVYWRSMMR